MRRMDHQPLLEQRARQPVEQRRAIAGVDLDHGEAVRGLVVEHHPRVDIESLGAVVRQRTLRQPRLECDPVASASSIERSIRSSCAASRNGRPCGSWLRKLSTAQPDLVAWMRASMMLAPARWIIKTIERTR